MGGLQRALFSPEPPVPLWTDRSGDENVHFNKASLPNLFQILEVMGRIAVINEKREYKLSRSVSLLLFWHPKKRYGTIYGIRLEVHYL